MILQPTSKGNSGHTQNSKLDELLVIIHRDTLSFTNLPRAADLIFRIKGIK